jgi:hypothetical protein
MGFGVFAMIPMWESIFAVAGISRHEFGHVTGSRGSVTCYQTCPLVLVTWEVMGAKHDTVGKQKS